MFLHTHDRQPVFHSELCHKTKQNDCLKLLTDPTHLSCTISPLLAMAKEEAENEGLY